MIETPPDALRAAAPAATSDQASTLRRLFAAGGPWLLPILLPGGRDDARALMLARWVAGLPRSYPRVLAVDAARIQLGAALGVPLRRELADVLAGAVPLGCALVGAAPGLDVVAAARAVERAAARGQALDRVLAAAGVAIEACDAIVVVLYARNSACLHGVDRTARAGRASPGEALVPVVASADGIHDAIAAIKRAHVEADIGAFRLLFMGMDFASARTVFERMARMECAGGRGRFELRFGGAWSAADEPARLASASGGWNLMRIDPVRDRADLEPLS